MASQTPRNNLNLKGAAYTPEFEYKKCEDATKAPSYYVMGAHQNRIGIIRWCCNGVRAYAFYPSPEVWLTGTQMMEVGRRVQTLNVEWKNGKPQGEYS